MNTTDATVGLNSGGVKVYRAAGRPVTFFPAMKIEVSSCTVAFIENGFVGLATSALKSMRCNPRVSLVCHRADVRSGVVVPEWKSPTKYSSLTRDWAVVSRADDAAPT